jgi:hypothetical protein
MRGGVASGTGILRAMWESGRRTGGTANQPGSRTRETGRDLVDGLLCFTSSRRFNGDPVRPTRDREAGCDSEWTATGVVSVAATVPRGDWLANFGEGSGWVLHWMGFAATGRMGESIGARDGVPGAIECADRYSARSLYVVGTAAVRI